MAAMAGNNHARRFSFLQIRFHHNGGIHLSSAHVRAHHLHQNHSRPCDAADEEQRFAGSVEIAVPGGVQLDPAELPQVGGDGDGPGNHAEQDDQASYQPDHHLFHHLGAVGADVHSDQRPQVEQHSQPDIDLAFKYVVQRSPASHEYREIQFRARGHRRGHAEYVDHGRYANEPAHANGSGQVAGGQSNREHDPERHAYVGHREMDHGRQLQAVKIVGDAPRGPGYVALRRSDDVAQHGKRYDGQDRNKDRADIKVNRRFLANRAAHGVPGNQFGVDPHRKTDSDSSGGEHEHSHFLVDVAHFTVLAGADQRLTELVRDVGTDRDDSRHPEVHHARGHEERAAAADEPAQRAADEPQQHDLHHRRCVQRVRK